MDIQIIATPIVGAVIGYTTNWVAIKMLFRPYTQKRFLGVKIPFTPGLIPKERFRIASAIGEVVEQYLLTDEVIVSELLSPTMQKNIASILEGGLLLEDGTLDLSKLLGGQDVDFLDSIVDSVIERAFEVFFADVTVQQISELVKDKIIEHLDQKSIEALVSENKELVQGLLVSLWSEENIERLSQMIEAVFEHDKTFQELLGEDLILQVKGILSLNEPQIKQSIINTIHGETFSSSVKAMISEVITSKFGALGAMFAKPDSIYEGIAHVVDDKVATTSISDILNNYLQVGLEKQVIELIPEHTKKGVCSIIAKKVLSQNTQSHLERQLLNKKETPYQWLNQMSGGKMPSIIDAIMSGIVAELTTHQSQLKLYMKPKIVAGINSFIQKPIKLTDTFVAKLNEKTMEAYGWIIKNYVTKMIKTAKISTIIEKQINTFEVKMLEEVILAISKKELSAITWLGGLLGFIMSIILLFLK
ncbi:MAG: DUF445 family protein [Vallitaleaceae bacterium]|nr:DUF445 family protein [Vallitaleaceae bacterium]